MGEWVPLSHNHIREGLSEIQLIVGGGGFAFTKLNCAGKEPAIMHLGNKLEECVHLREIVLSNNAITDITATAQLSHLLKLQIDNNAVNQISCLAGSPNLPWLQQIDLTNNQIKVLPPLFSLPKLRFLKLEGNSIASLELGTGHEALEELELQGNELESLKGLGCLKSLRFLNASNQKEKKLASLEGLDAPMLSKLDVSGNSLATLKHISGVPVCAELFVSDNALGAPEEADSIPEEFVELGKALPMLRFVAVAGNPVGEMKSELLFVAPQLKKIDEEDVTNEHREAAKARGEEIRLAIEERERLAAEAKAEEERLKAEEEAAAAAEAAAAEAEGGGD
jgi:hypothetical protein